ncbi:hypothetical protein EVAR_17116_1 [Eumeta japonica]|uniref:Uncharacterized protein n=1 Tax=Eumeta variegata TaxID=151549 RepID=A0A4C1ULW2_EUMVA|nr:hypothetical protein EVAR_17116_1 [Eumeta japonica]
MGVDVASKSTYLFSGVFSTLWESYKYWSHSSRNGNGQGASVLKPIANGEEKSSSGDHELEAAGGRPRTQANFLRPMSWSILQATVIGGPGPYVVEI